MCKMCQKHGAAGKWYQNARNYLKETAEEAKEYISCKDDFTSDDIDNAEYFTLTPSLKGEGWEDVTYFTKRPTTMYANRDGDFDSWVYIMSNPSSPGYYKIGYTKKSPEERHLGFIAEDVPELVASKDRKGMSSMDVVAVLTKVVQEQQKTVQEQRTTIADLSRRLAVVERGVKIAKYQD